MNELTDSDASQYFIATTLALFHHLQEQIAASYVSLFCDLLVCHPILTALLLIKVEKRWGNRTEVLAGGTGYRQFRDQTVGFLGYGQVSCALLPFFSCSDYGTLVDRSGGC